MSEYNNFDNHSGRPRESLDEAVRRLRGELASGELYVRHQLAELLMRQAHFAAESTRIDDAMRLVNESLSIVDDLLNDGQYEYRLSAIRCKIFKAALVRVQKGFEAALPEHNEVIRYINENVSSDNTYGMDMLAFTLMNKSEILNNLGANAAAAAAQEQAAGIWENLVNVGSFEFRTHLITALLALGSTRVQMGDASAGLADFKRCLGFIRDGIDRRLLDEEADYTGFFIQTLMYISRLVDRTGNTRDAISYASEAIDTIIGIVTSGQPQVMPILTGMYQHRGVLLDKTGNHRAALDDFERARDIYRQSLRGRLTSPSDYVVRTGLANVLMCCANIYANAGRFSEAESTYDEAVRIYQQAAEFRPVGDEDETFIPYSIGIVRLNYANMLSDRGRLGEAMVLQTQAIDLLKRRLDEGHVEILPNIISAYRKLAVVQRSLLDFPGVFVTLDKLVALLEAAIENGDFEFRGELALVFALRSIMHRELNEIDKAIDATKRAMNIFHAIADDEIESPEASWSKLQWGDSLMEVAKLYFKKGMYAEGFDFFKKQVDVVYSEDDASNRTRLFDLLFGYSQYVEFVVKFVQDEQNESKIKNELSKVIDDAIEIAKQGATFIVNAFPAMLEVLKNIVLEEAERYSDKDSQNVENKDNVVKVDVGESNEEKSGIDSNGNSNIDSDRSVLNLADPVVRLFFFMKFTFFYQFLGSLYKGVGQVDDSIDSYGISFAGWRALIAELDKLYLQRQYYVREAEAIRAMELEVQQSGGNYFDGEKSIKELSRRVPPEEFFEERWRYYLSELHGMLQEWASLELSRGRLDRATMVYRFGVEMTRGMVDRNVMNADRYLVVSLLAFARTMEIDNKSSKSYFAFVEALQLIVKRTESDCCLEDYEMFHHIVCGLASLLSDTDLSKLLDEVMELYINSLEQCKLPLPELSRWQELCTLPEIKPYTENFQQRCNNLKEKHPDYKPPV
ncbi:MAG: tetratricopeptide repeat protein [Planctomycetaceae bacterium]|jgi:tetratricopeptide (TPR) repeat protein|nr:tetratricopeptide repeat protein [Planctomycetaceae bacterium]